MRLSVFTVIIACVLQLLTPFVVSATQDQDDIRSQLGKCIIKKIIILDDGITGADSIADAVVQQCEGIVNKVYGSIDDEQFKDRKSIIISMILERRNKIKNNDIAKNEVIGAWIYMEDPIEKKSFALYQSLMNKGYILYSCEGSSKRKVLYLYVKGRSVFYTKIYFDDDKKNHINIDNWVREADDPYKALIGGKSLYKLMKKMKNKKTMSIEVNLSQAPLTFDLNGWQEGIERINAQ